MKDKRVCNNCVRLPECNVINEHKLFTNSNPKIHSCTDWINRRGYFI